MEHVWNKKIGQILNHRTSLNKFQRISIIVFPESLEVNHRVELFFNSHMPGKFKHTTNSWVKEEIIMKGGVIYYTTMHVNLEYY